MTTHTHTIDQIHREAERQHAAAIRKASALTKDLATLLRIIRERGQGAK